jgi:hypothetical protein
MVKTGHKYGTVITTLLSPGIRSARATSPQRSSGIHIHARLLVPALRVLPKHIDLLPTHAKWLLSISMQRTFDAMGVPINDVGASSVRVYEYAHDLAEALKDGADVGLVGVWG